MVNRSEDKAPRRPIDWYAVLGVSPDASAEAVRVAWRALARAWHPDRAGGGPHARDRFEAIQEAHRVLSDPELRDLHDRARVYYANAVAPLPNGVVERFMGVRRSEVEAGRNRLYRLTVSSADAITGASYEIDLPDRVGCDDCAATGVGPLGRPVVCDACGGRCFEVTRPVLRAVGEPCQRCDAAGWVPDRPCAACGGSGSVLGVRVVSAAVPAGVESGAQLRIAGQGEPGVGGHPRGDLLVVVDVAPGRYRVGGDDWEADERIPFWRALAGGPAAVATPWGERVVKIPAGTRDGDLLCLSGLGVARRGDGHLRVTLAWPAGLNEAEAASLVAWGESLSSPLDANSKEPIR